MLAFMMHMCMCTSGSTGYEPSTIHSQATSFCMHSASRYLHIHLGSNELVARARTHARTAGTHALPMTMHSPRRLRKSSSTPKMVDTECTCPQAPSFSVRMMLARRSGCSASPWMALV